MIKTTLNISGMACGMCECHVCDAIRKEFQGAKVTASYKKGEVIVITDSMPSEAQLTRCVSTMGYTVLSITNEPYTKKRFLFW